MNIATAYVELRVDASKAEKEGKSAVNKMGNDLGTSFGALFGAAAFAGGIAKSIDSASQLQQAVGASETVFGKASGAVDAFAKSSAEGFGISERAARELTAGIGALLQNFGFTAEQAATTSVELSKLGADLAAAFGGKPEEAVQALGAALRGEMDPVERFGISLNDAKLKAKALELGLYDGVGSLETNAKAQAALALITEQTAKVQGQAGREADTAAGQQARASAKLEEAAASVGANLLPAFSKAAELVGALADVFGSLPGPVQTAIIAMAGITALAGPAGKTIQLFSKLGSTIKDFVTGAKTISGAAGAVGGVIAVAAATYIAYQQGVKQAADRNKEFAKTLGEVSEALNTVTDDMVGQELNKLVGESLIQVALDGKELTSVFDDLAAANLEGAKRALVWAEANGQATIVVEGLRDAIADEEQAQKDANLGKLQAANTLGELEKKVVRVDRAERDWQDSLKAAEQAQKDQEQAVEDGKAALDELKDTLDEQTTAYDILASAADNLRSAIDSVFGGTFNLEEANRAYTAGVLELNEAWKTAGKEGDELKEVQDSLAAGLDINTAAGIKNRETVQSQVQKILDLGVASTQAGDSQEDVARKVNLMTEGLRLQLIQAGFTEEQVDSYIESLGLTPENVETTIQLAGDQAAKAEIEDIIGKLGEVDAGAVAEIQALVEAGDLDTALTKARELAGYDGKTVDMSVIAKLVGYGALAGQGYSAQGRYVPARSNFVTSTGEEGAEAILPLDKPDRLSALLGDPRIGGPVAAALGVTSSSTHTLSATVNNYREPVTVDVIARALAMARLS